MFVIVFIITFIISAKILKTVCDGFMALMGADFYFFSVSLRVVLCAIISFIVAGCIA